MALFIEQWGGKRRTTVVGWYKLQMYRVNVIKKLNGGHSQNSIWSVVGRSGGLFDEKNVTAGGLIYAF